MKKLECRNLGRLIDCNSIRMDFLMVSQCSSEKTGLADALTLNEDWNASILGSEQASGL